MSFVHINIMAKCMFEIWLHIHDSTNQYQNSFGILWFYFLPIIGQVCITFIKFIDTKISSLFFFILVVTIIKLVLQCIASVVWPISMNVQQKSKINVKAWLYQPVFSKNIVQIYCNM